MAVAATRVDRPARSTSRTRPPILVITLIVITVLAAQAMTGVQAVRLVTSAAYARSSIDGMRSVACLERQVASRVAAGTRVFVDEPPSEAAQRLYEVGTPRLSFVPSASRAQVTVRLTSIDAVSAACTATVLVVEAPPRP